MNDFNQQQSLPLKQAKIRILLRLVLMEDMEHPEGEDMIQKLTNSFPTLREISRTISSRTVRFQVQ